MAPRLDFMKDDSILKIDEGHIRGRRGHGHDAVAEWRNGGQYFSRRVLRSRGMRISRRKSALRGHDEAAARFVNSLAEAAQKHGTVLNSSVTKGKGEGGVQKEKKKVGSGRRRPAVRRLAVGR